VVAEKTVKNFMGLLFLPHPVESGINPIAFKR